MILKENYELQHIEELKLKTGNDPVLIERCLFAFGLLEALRKVELPFIFKGGTCLMLLLKEPKRLSTDIDIIVDPNTTGIAYNSNKDMEIIKQMFDVSCLIDEFDDQNTTLEIYKNCVSEESKFRGKSFTYQECLIDTIKTCLCICSRGRYDSSHYQPLLYGIRCVKSHIFGAKYTGEIAAQDACKILYFASCLVTNSQFQIINEPVKDEIHLQKPFNLLSPIRKIYPIAFSYVVESSKLLKGFTF